MKLDVNDWAPELRTDGIAVATPYRFGPVLSEGGALFRLWAPSLGAVQLLLPDQHPIPMNVPEEEGWFEAFVEGVKPGQHYRFAAGDQAFADPASRMQATDADGWSVLVDAFPPHSSNARRSWHEVVLAEIHVGTATPEGTFRALAERLPHFSRSRYAGIRGRGHDGAAAGLAERHGSAFRTKPRQCARLGARKPIAQGCRRPRSLVTL